MLKGQLQQPGKITARMNYLCSPCVVPPPNTDDKKELYFRLLLTRNHINHCLSSSLRTPVNIGKEANARYRVRSGFFNDVTILISLNERDLRLSFNAETQEQAYALHKLSSEIERKISSELQSCHVEVIFENRRL